jgi:hypothetical protein
MINIGSLIYSNLNDLVDTRCYPLIAEQSTEFPFMIYRSNSTAPNTTKDNIYEWEHSVEITICNDEYDLCCSLAESVIYRLLSMEGQGVVNEVVVDTINEDFIENAYVKVITVRIYTTQA